MTRSARLLPIHDEQAPDVREATERPSDDRRTEDAPPKHGAPLDVRGEARLGGAAEAPAGGDLIERLGMLDDAVFDAIAGRSGAIEKLRRLWPELRSSADAEIVEESREQYVRRALVVWRENLSGGALRDPAAAIAVLDVVSLLFDER